MRKAEKQQQSHQAGDDMDEHQQSNQTDPENSMDDSVDDAHQHGDDMDDDAHVDAARLLGKLRAALEQDHDIDLHLPPLPSDDEDDYDYHYDDDDDDDSFLRSNASFLDRTDAEADHFLHSDDNAGRHSMIDEGELRRHLMDVESSFMPDVAPMANERGGQDDTFVRVGPRPAAGGLGAVAEDASESGTQGVALRERDEPRGAASRSLAAQPSSPSGHSRSSRGQSESSLGPSKGAQSADGDNNDSYDNRDDDDDNYDDEYNQDRDMHFDPTTQPFTSSDQQPSSPSAAAAERTHSRATSQNSRTPYLYDGTRSSTRSSSAASSSHATHEHRSTTPSSQPHNASLRPSDMGSANPFSSLRSYSQRSYAGDSTFTPDDSGLNADYALQTGGAIPSDPDHTLHSHHSGRSGLGLSRLPSFGSVASAVSRDEDDEYDNNTGDNQRPSYNRRVSGGSVLANLRAERQLARLDEEDHFSVLSDPVTPRPPAGSTFSAPTDTVIAQHVQNIQVPDTVAREYHQRNRSESPEKSRPQSASTLTFQGRPRSGNLTLKEQNSKIDKLTKENFDLKLKIHFLDQALQNRSDEGVKDMINKNVQFQTDLANERKENQSLRRRIRELERKLKEHDEELANAKKAAEEAHTQSGSNDQLEFDIVQLSEEIDRCQVKITRLSADNMAKDIEKRKMAEYISALNDRKGNEQSAAEEESEMWKDLLTTETARREQAEDDARKLREEIVMLRADKSAETSGKTWGIGRLRGQKQNHSRSASRESGGTQDRSGANTASSLTLADSLNLTEQLKHENAELRRDLGAQTSMLTSRNKERERLQQEIEDLKLLHRKGEGARSIAGDSILDRSISRQHQRAASRASGQTTTTAPMTDGERDEWERREGMLRDQNAALRMDYQDLEREFISRNAYVDELEQAIENLEATYDSAIQDLQALQKERDDALQALDDREREAARFRSDYEKLKEEAVNAINELEGDLDGREDEAKRLASDLKDRNDDFNALQRELQDLNTSLMQLEDDRAAALKRIDALEQEIDEATQELEAQDKKLSEATQKIERMDVQQESLHSEVAFLREEQESDKVKIGDLENSLNAAQQSVNDEREKMQEIEYSLLEERRQREIVDNQSKKEVQKVLNDLNIENSNAKDEVRRLRRAVSTKEVETIALKRTVEEIEVNLRRILGDCNGKRSGWFNEIEKLQTNLEATMDQLERTKRDLADKDRLLRNRDMLLESTGLESRRLNDLLDKEREARKRDLHQYEQSQRGHSVNNRQMAQHESRVLELETAHSQDRRRMALLEQQYRDQLIERNNLLFALWNRLSTLCGVQWAQNHSLINGEVTSVDVIARSLPSFNKNIIEAIRTIESIVGSFKQRIRSVEKTLWKDYQILSTNLDGRIKRMDFLERAVKDAQTQIEEQAREQSHLRLQHRSSRSSMKSPEEVNRLKQEIKTLKSEVKFYKEVSASPKLDQQQPQSSSEGKRVSSTSILSARAIANSLTRHHSSTSIEQLQKPGSSSGNKPIVIATPPIAPTEQRWMHRLREMEKRLKAEREARLLDRKGARQRLDERSAENEELRLQLEREKDRRGSVTEEDDGGDAGVSVGGRDDRGRPRPRDGSLD